MLPLKKRLARQAATQAREKVWRDTDNMPLQCFIQNSLNLAMGTNNSGWEGKYIKVHYEFKSQGSPPSPLMKLCCIPCVCVCVCVCVS